jgi:hypothetical protein
VNVTNLPFGPDYPYSTVNTINGNVATFITPTGDAFVVDAADFDYVSQFKWFTLDVHPNRLNKHHYIARTDYSEPKQRSIYLHRSLLGVTDTRTKVDHKNGDPCDNRRENLRVATNGQNLGNSRKRLTATLTTSRFKGVSYARHARKWKAGINTRHLGYFFTEEAAAVAYNDAALEVFGEFASLNDVGDVSQVTFIELAKSCGMTPVSELSEAA